MVLRLISAPFEYAYSLVESLQYDEILGVIAEVDPFKAYVLMHIRIIQGVYSDVVNLLVMFPLEQYSWFYMFLFFFLFLVFGVLARFVVRKPVRIAIIILAVWGD